MRILAIETSCDETGISIIDASGTFEAGDFSCTVLGDALMTQMALHAQYGGVFPMLAKREHQKNLVPVLTQALTQADLLQPKEPAEDSLIYHRKLEDILTHEKELLTQAAEFLAQFKKPDIDAIAVTYGPGLEPALWVGVNFAEALSVAWDVPVIPVNHMEGHIIISLLRNDESKKVKVKNEKSSDNHEAPLPFNLSPLTFPALSLLVSGGHTEIVLMNTWMDYQVVGQTRDDALGEAFDKVARLLNLPYPGGPNVSRLAEEARANNIQSAHTLTRPMIHTKDLDFSFSGLKSQTRRLIESQQTWSPQETMALAREFEDCVTETVVAKVEKAITQFGAQSLIVGGGVSANRHLRKELENLAGTLGISLYMPSADKATDNGLMIALAGYFRAPGHKRSDGTRIIAKGTLPLA